MSNSILFNKKSCSEDIVPFNLIHSVNNYWVYTLWYPVVSSHKTKVSTWMWKDTENKHINKQDLNRQSYCYNENKLGSCYSEAQEYFEWDVYENFCCPPRRRVL